MRGEFKTSYRTRAAAPQRRRRFSVFFALFLAASCTPTEPRQFVCSTRGNTFIEGDAIFVEAAYGPDDRFTEGGNYKIEGTYFLNSRDEALLAFYITNGKVSGRNRMRVRRGQGRFEFEIEVEEGGMPHISYYPPVEGSSFGGVYLSTKYLANHVYPPRGGSPVK
ncbi:MAG: hypothetical protein ACYTFG_05720 [Planctomycetota bacterium]|jgi:hypothetical protein